MLDLDGDGIETVGISPGAPILFDHDADGSRTGTGWVKSDDGLLVLDVNGNGVIDSGRELFGDNTRLGNPANNVNATNGYQALAQHDSNGDGKINSTDAIYSQLRVWRDLNQDGISQANELQTLAQTGIASIGVAGTASNTNLGNGNTQVFSGTFTRSNGTAGQSGVAELSGSLLLASNNFYRQFTDNPALTPAAKALPQMQGSGWVRDMREAASLGTPAAAVLQQRLAAFAAATTKTQQMALLEGVIEAWATTTGAVKSAVQRPVGIWTLNVRPAGLTTTTSQSTGGAVTTLTAAGSAFLNKLSLLEVFNGDNFFTLTAPDANGNVRLASGGGGGSGTGAAAGGPIEVNLSQAQVDSINSSWAALADSVYTSLVMQTRLRPYLDSIELVVDASGVSFDTAKLGASLDVLRQNNATVALLDLLELVRFAGDTLKAVGFVWAPKLLGWLGELPADSPMLLEAAALGVLRAGAAGTVNADVYQGDTSANYFSAGKGDDALGGGAGNDTLNGGDGADTLQGGAGNDSLDGGTGNDRYRLAAGAGIDRISDYDTTAGNVDVVSFAGVASTAVTATERRGSDLFIQYGTSDQLTVLRYFDTSYPGFQIEQFQFSDGVIWDRAAIYARFMTYGSALADNITGLGNADNRIYGLDGNDTLNGGLLADTLDGGAGDDTLNGNAGADSLIGGAGNDTLSGGDGADTLQGGAGNDSLDGGTGNDRYQLAAGAGIDRISDYDTTAGNVDVVSIGAGITADQMWFRRVGSDLEVSIIGTTDKLVMSNWYSGSQYHVEQFKSGNGKTLLDSQVQNLVSAMAGFTPPAAGVTTLPANYATALQPVLAANWV